MGATENDYTRVAMSTMTSQPERKKSVVISGENSARFVMAVNSLDRSVRIAPHFWRRPIVRYRTEDYGRSSQEDRMRATLREHSGLQGNHHAITFTCRSGTLAFSYCRWRSLQGVQVGAQLTTRNTRQFLQLQHPLCRHSSGCLPFLHCLVSNADRRGYRSHAAATRNCT